MREKLQYDGIDQLDLGITPASAGKTISFNSALACKRDHPRECGKNCVKSWLMFAVLGSPPRVREKRKYASQGGPNLRITPASAGKTALIMLIPSMNWDHPRECGKNSTTSVNQLPFSGSPPRVREKHLVKDVFHRQDGITPASAGKTKRSATAALRSLGSPPRVREKRFKLMYLHLLARITPASAGKTSPLSMNRLKR